MYIVLTSGFQSIGIGLLLTYILFFKGALICGLADGKIRLLNLKTNKSQTLYTTDSFAVSLASNNQGTGFLSGHADGTIVRFFTSDGHSEQQGRVLVHSVAPYALAWLQGQVKI